MLWFWKRKPRGDIVDLDGFAYPLDLLTRGLLITGGVGMGKSVASERFLAAAVRSEWPILGTAVKPDERIRYERLCDAIGVACRLTLVRPGGPWTIDLLGYLLAMPGGSPRAAAQFLGRLNDVLTRSEAGSRQDEAFWKTLFEETLLRAIELCVLATGSATIPAVYEVVISMPRSPKEAGSKGFLERSACGRRLAEARKRIEPTNRTFRQVVEFFITKIPTLGMKARGAAVQMATGVLSGFLADPFYDALCVTTTLTPEQIEAERRIVVLDYPTLVYGTPGRMFQLAWVMLCQMHCLRRDAARSDTPFLIVRDECGQTLHPGWDLQVSAVARSQKLAVIDITQDLDVLMQGLGGEQSRHEVTGFAALHQTRLMFGSTNAEMNELHSRMLGDRREVQVGGGSGGGSPPDADFADRLLGVTVGFSWSEHYEPWVRPGDFAKLRPGQAYLALGGQTFGKRPYHWADFWRR